MGYKRTDEWKAKMGERMRASNLENPRRYWLGKKIPEEMLAKMKFFGKGHEPWNKGKKLSGEIRKKLSEAHKGKKQSPEVLANRIKALARGEKHWHWKGGITPLNTALRTSEMARLWRTSVLDRDGRMCRRCGAEGGRLRCHHIVNWSDHPDLRFVTENGITLCNADHVEFHHRYGVKNNTIEQLEEFLNVADRSLEAA